MNFRSIRFLCFLVVLAFIQLNAQNTVTIVYSFDSDMSALVSDPQAVHADDAVVGGTKLQNNGIVDDLGVRSLSATVRDNNSTNYQTAFLQANIKPRAGYRLQINEIKVTQRSSKAGIPSKSQTYLYRIGCALNGTKPLSSDPTQSTENRVFYVSYKSDVFIADPGFPAVSGDDFVSVYLAARGASTSNDVFVWYIDEVEVTATYYKPLDLPVFLVHYAFEGGSKLPAVSGENNIQASSMSANAATEGLTDLGKYWIRMNSNSNTIGFKNLGLMFDIEPNPGYEVVLNHFEIVHAGSGVAGESRVNRMAAYRDLSRTNAGIEIGREDFSTYTGRAVYGDQVSAAAFKTTVFQDNHVFASRQFFTLSVNRTGSPANVEFWTVDDVKVHGWLIPAGRGNLLKHIVQGESLLISAKIGEQVGEYTKAVYDELLMLLLNATDSLNNAQVSEASILQLTEMVEQAVTQFPSKANTGKLVVAIDINSGIPLNEGFAGFNMRIVDGPWTYTHPEFKEAVRKMNPGFLRYFSGTSGDYFDIHTGQYELQWFEGTSSGPETGGDDGSLDDFNSIPNLYKWMEGKGVHRFIDYYTMCGEMGTRTVVTWNGFYESAQKAAQFARFCKNNNIIVDSWQFCNEPNFFTPPRRYFWNDGEDYTAKMREIADSIKSVFPDANLALSYGWSFNTNSFASQIKAYQNKNSRYWNQVSIHAYPTHRKDANFYESMLTANNALETHTNNSYFSAMTNQSWTNSQLLLTEFGVWNDKLNSTNYSAIYVAEYFMRLSQQPQAWMIGKHHIASAVQPMNKFQAEIMAAYENQTPINTDLLNTGYLISNEGYAHYLVNKVFKNSTFVWKTTHNNKETVLRRGGGSTSAIYTTSYKGMNDRDYMLISNKTEHNHKLNIVIDGDTLRKQVDIHYFSDNNPQNAVTTILTESVAGDSVIVPPYSVMRIEWLKEQTDIPVPLPTRIYQVQNNQGSVLLRWWKREIATSYIVKYGTTSGVYNDSVEVTDNSVEIVDLQTGILYYFVVVASNDQGLSANSNEVTAKIAIPEQPRINHIHEDNQRVSIHWESVPFANGYKVKYGTAPGVYSEVIDAKNVTGYLLRRLNNNTTYYITVVAYNGMGESEQASEVVAIPVANRPWPPYLVSATEEDNGAVKLKWTPSDSTHNANFNVYYCPTPWDESNYQLIGSNVKDTSFIDLVPRDKGYHYYRVKAVNQVGMSHFYSAIATVNKAKSGISKLDEIHPGTFRIYPNPAKDVLFVKAIDGVSPVQYNIFDSTGRLLKKGIGEQIEINELDPGLLIVELTQHGVIEKIIKE